MKAPVWLRGAGVMFGLQAVMGGLAYFLYPLRPLAVAFGLLFFVAVWQTAAAYLRGRPRWEVWAGALLFQVLGLVGTVNMLAEQLYLWRYTSFGDILDFIMETWHTVLLPWLSLLPEPLLPTRIAQPMVPFYLMLPLLSPLLVAWVVVAASRTRSGHDLRRSG